MKHPCDLEDHLREVHKVRQEVDNPEPFHVYDHEHGWDSNHTHPD